MCVARIRLWLVECEQREAKKEARMIDLDENPLDILSKRSTEIQRITRECDENCINELHMGKNAFALLCDLLQTCGGLVYDGVVTIEEQVAIFLNILAHPTKTDVSKLDFIGQGCLGAIFDRTYIEVNILDSDRPYMKI
ncbi:hypothetical protein LXL04_025501 [Taraxacum kok-saghyz]